MGTVTPRKWPRIVVGVAMLVESALAVLVVLAAIEMTRSTNDRYGGFTMGSDGRVLLVLFSVFAAALFIAGVACLRNRWWARRAAITLLTSQALLHLLMLADPSAVRPLHLTLLVCCCSGVGFAVLITPPARH